MLYLTNNSNALSLFDWIEGRETTYLYSERISETLIRSLNPKMVLSYNYNYIISENVINATNGNVVNMHISFLPWNRGFSPNIWSFIDDTPKGYTIHKLVAGLDKGEIIYQEKVNFDVEKETFTSSYNSLNQGIVELCKMHWNELQSGEYESVPQKGRGSYHSFKDLERLQEKVPFEWDDTIKEFLEIYRNKKANDDGKAY